MRALPSTPHLARGERSALLLAGSILLALAAAARGDDLSDLAGLLNEPVVTTASKSAETAALAPATTSIITGEDLRRHGIDSLHDAIDYLASGMVTEQAYGTPEIGSRGVLLSGDYGNHVLLLVDGHAVNEPWDGTAYYDWSAAIPLDLVDHIEVILGPGSVLYGSSAMLGVIQVITKRARDYEGVHAVAEGSWPWAGHASVGYGRRLSLGGQEGGLTGAVDWFRARGPRLSWDEQPYEGTTWGGDATHHETDVPAAHLRLVLGGLDVGLRAAMSRRTATQIMGSFDDPDSWEQDRWLSLDVRYTAALTGRLQVTARAYGDLYDYNAHIPWPTSADCLDGQERCLYRALGRSRWFGGELSGTWDWLGDGRYVTLAGGEARRNAVDSWVDYRDLDTSRDTRTSGYDRGATVLAAYVQQTLRPARWLTLNLGVRLDHDQDQGSHLSPRAAAVIPVWPGGTVKAIYSEAFRAASFYERFYSDPTTELQAGALDPETVRSVEGVIEQRVGSQRLRLSAFRSWWEDLVVLVGATDAQVAAGIADGALAPGASPGAVYVYENASRVDSYGLSADWEGTGLGQRLRYGASVTAAHSRRATDAGDVELAAAAQLFGNAHASWDLGGGLPTLGLALRATAARPAANTDYDPTPEAEPQLQLRGAVSGPIAAGLAYRLALDWSLSGESPYAAGMVTGPDNGLGRQPLMPIPRFRATVGLRFDR